MSIFDIRNNVVMNVVYFNTLASSGTYGATLTQPRTITLVDGSGNTAFPNSGGSIDYTDILPPAIYGGTAYVDTVAETSQHYTIGEPTLAANTTYGLNIFQRNSVTAGMYQLFFQFNTGTGSLAAGTFNTALNAAMIAAGFQVSNTNTATATMTIATSAGYPLLNIPAGSNYNNLLTITNTQTGAVSVGQSTDMPYANDEGYSWSSYPGYISTNNYNKWDVRYKIGNNYYRTVLFVNNGDTNHANFKTALVTNILELYAGSTSAAHILPAVAASA